MSALIAIVIWYAVGFFIADRLVARGRSASVWWPAAAILGTAIVVPAAAALLRRSLVNPLSVLSANDAATDGDGLHVLELIGRTDEETAFDRLPVSLNARAGRTTVVGTVGLDAFSDVIDTGERARAIDRVTWVRPFATSVDRIVVPDTPAGIDSAIAIAGPPDVIVTSAGRSRRACRRSARRSLDLSCRHGVPVVLLPPAPAPTTREAGASPSAAATPDRTIDLDDASPDTPADSATTNREVLS